MKQIFCIVAPLAFFAAGLYAQPKIISTTLKQSGNFTSGYGRDFRFCIEQNYEATQQQDKFYHVYVTSDRSTTVNFQISGQAVIKKNITKDSVTSFDAYTNYPGDFPIATELKSSGVVASDKAIHVWSDDADISVYLLSSVPFSTDGSYVIPTTGWGTEYVVASYKDLYFPPGDVGSDWPSEFAVIANQDNTMVTINPTWDIRQDGLRFVVQHPRNVPFTVNLNRGECIQFQAIQDLNDADCDVTGTHIVSNVPIGVMGASAAPYLPGPWPLDCCGDYVMDMMQPTRTWSNSYFTCPFANRTVSGDMFLVIGTRDSQIINRNGQQILTVGKLNFTTSNYIVDVHGVSIWTSDAPFMLVQYMEGQSHNENDPTNPNPAIMNPAGDPCDVVINATDLFSKKIVFQTPVINLVRTQQNTFINYVNVILPISEEANTTFDGVSLKNGGGKPPNVQSIVRLPMPNVTGLLNGWEAVQILFKKGFGEGAHVIVSDTGVGVYVYGQGSYESYAWSGNLGVASVHIADTIPPTAIASGSCFSTHVIVTDNQPNASKLSSIVSDSLFNMTFMVDSNFIAGADSSLYDLHVIDGTLEAFARVFVYDGAGNKTTVTSTYQKPSLLSINPEKMDFGTVLSGKSNTLYANLCNPSSSVIHFISANLNLTNGRKNDTLGFSIDTLPDQDIPAGGGCMQIKVTLNHVLVATVADTVNLLYNTCLKISLPLTGNGGQPDYTLSDFDFGCIDTGMTKKMAATIADNISESLITIDSIRVDDTVHFTYTGILPVSIANNLTASFPFAYKATAKEYDTTFVHFFSPEAGERSAKLTGCGQIPASVRSEGYSSQLPASSSEYLNISDQLTRGDQLAALPPVPNPVSGSSNSVRFVFGLASASPLDLSLYDILGNNIATILRDDNHQSGIFETDFPVTSGILPGTYIYRLSASGKVISGKLMIVR